MGNGKGRLLRGGLLLGFAEPLSTEPQKLDLRIDPEGRVTDIGQALQHRKSDELLNLEGRYVSPAWIDLHAHIYHSVCEFAVNPSLVGPSTGVGMLVDAGSAGEASFEGLRRFVIECQPFPLRAFLNIGTIGLIACNRVSEISSADRIDLVRSKRCINENRDLIVGVKVRASRNLLGDPPSVVPVEIAKRLADSVKLPLMLHIGEPPILLSEVVDILGRGDIITHCFHGKVGNGLADDPDYALPLYRKARDKGIILDVGHGAAGFSLDSARLAMQAGLLPDVISTDVHARNIEGPVWCLPDVLSKFLNMGMPLPDVIHSVTKNPAEILRLESWCRLQNAEPAKLTVFTVRRGTFQFEDARSLSSSPAGKGLQSRVSFSGEQYLLPEAVILGGALFEASTRGRNLTAAKSAAIEDEEGGQRKAGDGHACR